VLVSVELRVEQVTPALIGYHTPEIIDDLYFLRPTSLKGVWRWVARAVVAGILYDRNLLIGRSDRDYVRIPTREEAEVISCIVGKELGLGYAGEKEESTASAFRVVVSVDRKPRVTDVDSYQANQRRLQRLVLLTLGRRSVKYFENGTFTVKLINTRTMDREKVELAIRTLILALTIMGVGKGSRRGLGSFDIVNVQGLEIERSFRDFMETTYKLAERIILASSAIRRLREGFKGLPPMPVISKSAHSIHLSETGTRVNRKVTTIYTLENVNWVDVHNIFLRGVRSRKGVDALTQKREAWILGLPRSQKKTGYVVKNVDRRASPILVSVHNRHIFNDVRKGVVVTFLTSADWPKSMKWVGASTKSIMVDEALIANAMMNAENLLLNLLGKPNLTPIWP